jgi:K+-transporting ATPase ATPase A chain
VAELFCRIAKAGKVMTTNGWIQILLYAGVILAVTKPMGSYMFRVFEGERHPLPKLFGPIERFLCRLCGVDPRAQQTWKEYTIGMLVFSAITLLVTYAIERLQHVLPLNPQNLGPVPAELAFNTAASFTTNTNWQAYSGESTMSYLTQMAGLAWHNFISAAVGIAIAIALARGITYRLQPNAAKTIGNFWVDLIRCALYVLLPICIPVTL